MGHWGAALSEIKGGSIFLSVSLKMACRVGGGGCPSNRLTSTGKSNKEGQSLFYAISGTREMAQWARALAVPSLITGAPSGELLACFSLLTALLIQCQA